MKQIKNYLKSKQMDNRGLSLIELLMAIAILAIIIVPVFGSFITSARVNHNSRRTLAATDVAQTIFEGFADKTYSGVTGSIGQLGSGVGVLSGNNALSMLDNNYYNDTGNYQVLDTTGALDSIISFDLTTRDHIRFHGTDYLAVDMISGNGVPSTVSFNQAVAAVAATKLAGGAADKAIMSWMNDGNGMLAALVYSGIEMEGQCFDAVVTFLPMAKTATEKYYTYCVTVTVYDAGYRVDPSLRFTDDVLMNVMIGGMAQ